MTPNDKAGLLVVEDDASQRDLVASILESAGYAVRAAVGAEAAIAALERASFDLVLTDWKLGAGADGTSILRWLRDRGRDEALILATAYGTVAHAVETVRDGADDYLAKPFTRAALLFAIERTLKARRLLAENRRLAAAVEEREHLVDLIGRAKAMQAVYRQIERVAPAAATVLLTGESGTGKELAARAIHRLSPRAAGPFVVVNCAAVPAALAEAEFFGSRAGAFTDARRDRAGKFAAAESGTLFLDEVGELPLELQPKLLRVLQEKRYAPVGDDVEKVADVRIIAATNRDLAEEVETGRFREDLFFRLNVLPIRMPALRDRREDLPILIEHFVRTAARAHGFPIPLVPPDLERRLLDHFWPGNVRELANAVERLVVLSQGQALSSDDLPADFGAVRAIGADFRLPPEGIQWDALEKSLFAQAVALANGNRKRAAALLGLPYRTFLYRYETRG